MTTSQDDVRVRLITYIPDGDNDRRIYDIREVSSQNDVTYAIRLMVNAVAQDLASIPDVNLEFQVIGADGCDPHGPRKVINTSIYGRKQPLAIVIEGNSGKDVRQFIIDALQGESK